MKDTELRKEVEYLGNRVSEHYSAWLSHNGRLQRENEELRQRLNMVCEYLGIEVVEVKRDGSYPELAVMEKVSLS